MAINGLVFAPSETRVGISQEATFGTPIADNGAFEMLQSDIPTGIDYGLFEDHSVKNNGSRMAATNGTFVTESGGLRTIPVNNIVVRLETLGELLYGVCQNVSEGATTPYTKTFTLTNTTTQPNFAANAGYFVSLAIRDVIAGYHQKWTSSIIKTLVLSADLVGGDGRLMANAEFISGFATGRTATLSGTWAYDTQTYFNFNNLTSATLDSADLVLYGFSLSITNNATRVGNGTTGNCQTYALPMYEITGSITVKYDANCEAMLVNRITGSAVPLIIEVGTSGASGHFKIDLGAILLTSGPDKDYGRAQGQALTLPFKAFYSSSDTNEMAVFTVSDAKDQAW